MPKKTPNPNKLRRQPTPDSPPRRKPSEPDWEAVAHEEAGKVGTTHGAHAGGRRTPRR